MKNGTRILKRELREQMCVALKEAYRESIYLEPGCLKTALQVLEPDAGKLARPVLRGGNHGNVISLLDNRLSDGLNTYRYDPLDRLIEVQTPQGSYQYIYDALGVRHEVAQILVVAKQQPQILLCDSTRRCV